VNSVYVSAVTGSPVTVSAGATATAGVNYTLRAGSGGAWVTNKSGTAVQFTAAQLGASGSPVPPVILSGLPSANALSFDGRGNLWIASGSSGNDQITEYTAAQLSATGSPAPALTLTSTNQSISLPQQIAFDLGGNLWVANQIAGTVVEFAASQLAGLSGTHALPPAVTLTSADWGANAVGTIAFDIHGTLWVYGFSSGKIGVYGYAASSLTGSGSVPATAVLTNSTFSSGPQTILFDPSGHLWVTTDGTVIEFTAAQIAAGGAQTATVTIVLPGTNAFINAAGFDDGGDLWVADGGSSAIFAYTAVQLGTGGSVTPAIAIASNGGSLSSPTAIGFDPHGIGVPLANRVRGTPPRAY
jgi:ligand-binding sensor domain-containing protein